MAQRTFVKFHIDVGVGDVVVDPVEHIKTRDWLGFAEIPPALVPLIQREQQFAEKLHAYTLSRTGTTNSRVRDLADMLLLIESGTLDSSVVAEALRRTFDRRGTHPVPIKLELPPPDWDEPFQRLADECQLNSSVSAAFAKLSDFFGMVIGSTSAQIRFRGPWNTP